jgi:phosphate transport system protein
MSMESRKVQLTGSSTYTISLPKEWAVENGIEPGMDLTLCPDDGSLEVCTGSGSRSEISVDASALDAEQLRRTVFALYVSGFDTTRIQLSEESAGDQRRAISSAADDLAGVEVLGAGGNTVRLTNLLDAGELSLDRTLLQLQYDALSMHSDAIRVLTAGDEAARRVRDDAKTIDRRHAVLVRHANRGLTDPETRSSLDASRRSLLDYLAVADDMHRLASVATDLVDGVANLDDTPTWTDEVTVQSRRARSTVEDAVDAILDGDDADAGHVAVRDAQSVTTDADELARRIHDERPDEPYAFSRCVESIRRTAACGERLGRRAIQVAYRPA